jgi:AcrR family transcriptional regulator
VFLSRFGVLDARYDGGMTAGQSARARVRVEVTREIVAAAREELASVGAAGLSLRAVARRLEMVPSALYRYFPSRDALLTALIVEAYEAVGRAAAEADGRGGEDLVARWVAVATAVRRWGRDHRNEWALVYGSPVPGYQAPQDTVEAALKVTRVIAGVFADGVRPGTPAPSVLPAAPDSLADALRPIEAELLPRRAPEVVAWVVMAWTGLIGMVSLELFGHYEGATTDFEQVFVYNMAAIGHLAGLG